MLDVDVIHRISIRYSIHFVPQPLIGLLGGAASWIAGSPDRRISLED
jgi:hypothetical protein